VEGDGAEVGAVGAGTTARPLISGEGVPIDVSPEVGVGVCNTVQARGPENKRFLKGVVLDHW